MQRVSQSFSQKFSHMLRFHGGKVFDLMAAARARHDNGGFGGLALNGIDEWLSDFY